jgi:hypothetical protein
MLTELIQQRPAGRAGLSEWYAAIFEAQEATGTPMAKLATDTGMTVANLYNWRRRLRGSGSEQGLVRVVVEGSSAVHGAVPLRNVPFEVRCPSGEPA